MFLLDTNVISELRKTKAGKANQRVVEWATDVSGVLTFVSVVTLHELEHGVLLAERSDPAKGEVLRQWLDTSVLSTFAERTISIDASIARRAAALHVPNPAPYRDAFIAASALEQEMTVVTRNVADFERFDDVPVINPWN